MFDSITVNTVAQLKLKKYFTPRIVRNSFFPCVMQF